MTQRITPFPGRPAAGRKSDDSHSRDAQVISFLPEASPDRAPPRGRGTVPSVHQVDVTVVGANPLLNALAVLAELKAGRRVGLIPLMDADPWAYELVDRATFHRFVDAAAETILALNPSRRLDFRRTQFPVPSRELLFSRMRERRRRMLFADVMRIEAGLAPGLFEETPDGLCLRLSPKSAAPRFGDEHRALMAAAETEWSDDIPRAVFDETGCGDLRVLTRAVVLTSAGALAGAADIARFPVKAIGSAAGPYADAVAREDAAFDDVLAAIRPAPYPIPGEF